MTGTYLRPTKHEGLDFFPPLIFSSVIPSIYYTHTKIRSATVVCARVIEGAARIFSIKTIYRLDCRGRGTLIANRLRNCSQKSLYNTHRQKREKSFLSHHIDMRKWLADFRRSLVDADSKPAPAAMTHRESLSFFFGRERKRVYGKERGIYTVEEAEGPGCFVVIGADDLVRKLVMKMLRRLPCCTKLFLRASLLDATLPCKGRSARLLLQRRLS